MPSPPQRKVTFHDVPKRVRALLESVKAEHISVRSFGSFSTRFSFQLGGDAYDLSVFNNNDYTFDRQDHRGSPTHYSYSGPSDLIEKLKSTFNDLKLASDFGSKINVGETGAASHMEMHQFIEALHLRLLSLEKLFFIE